MAILSVFFSILDLSVLMYSFLIISTPRSECVGVGSRRVDWAVTRDSGLLDRDRARASLPLGPSSLPPTLSG